MATIKEIAKACNVSIATVSNILNHKGKVSEETRALVQKKVEELNYIPNVAAKNLKQQTSRTIGIITEDLTVFNAPEIVDGIDDCLERHGYNFLLGNLRIYRRFGESFYYHTEFKSKLDAELAAMQANQVEGIIYVSSHSRNLSAILDGNTPLPAVVVYGFTECPSIPSVTFHDEDAAFRITRLLLEKRPGPLGILAGDRNSLHTSERLLGCQKALFASGLCYNPSLLYYGDWSREFGYDAMKRILAAGARAVFSMNDSMAAGAYDFMAEHGLLAGRDIAIGGIGNEISDVLRPRLSTVEMPLFEMGQRAAELILRLLENPQSASELSCRITGKLRNTEGGSI